MLHFIRPQVGLIHSNEFKNQQHLFQYTQFDRAFIVTNQNGYENLLKHAEQFFANEAIEFFGNFVATEGLDYVISVQWGILETFIRIGVEQALTGVKNIPHLIYDILSNSDYRQLFPNITYSEQELHYIYNNLDDSSYDLLSYEDLYNLEPKTAVKHITTHVKIICDKKTAMFIQNNINFMSCIEYACTNDSVIIPSEILSETKLLKDFKKSCELMQKIKNQFSGNFSMEEMLQPTLSAYEIVLEVTLEDWLLFFNKFVHGKLTMENIIVKIIMYDLLCLLQHTYGIFLVDQADSFQSLLNRDLDNILSAQNSWKLLKCNI